MSKQRDKNIRNRYKDVKVYESDEVFVNNYIVIIGKRIYEISGDGYSMYYGNRINRRFLDQKCRLIPLDSVPVRVKNRSLTSYKY